MAKELIIQELTDNGPRELGRLRGSQMVLGRESTDGIEVAVEGVSRNHGVFLQAKNNWLYADTESTNGSWVNGKKVTPGKWTVMRPGDTLQVANVMLRLWEVSLAPGATGDSGPRPASLIVLRHAKIVDEYPMPEVGQGLVVGGAGGDLQIPDEANGSEAHLVIERRDEKIVAVMGTGDIPVAINGSPAGEIQTLRDGDQVAVHDYLIVVNDSSTLLRPEAKAAAPARPSAIFPSSGPTGEIRHAGHMAFGHVDAMDPLHETTAMSDDQLESVRSGFGRRGQGDLDDDMEYPQQKNFGERFAMLEDSVILLISVGLVGAVLFLAIYWLFLK